MPDNLDRIIDDYEKREAQADSLLTRLVARRYTFAALVVSHLAAGFIGWWLG